MRRRGRQPQNDFAQDEPLYFRWFSNWIENRGVRPGNVATPNQSVSRAGHGGTPWHVLIPEPKPVGNVETTDDRRRRNRRICMGIVRITRADVPGDFVESGRTYRFVLEHDPLDHNYQ